MYKVVDNFLYFETEGVKRERHI